MGKPPDAYLSERRHDRPDACSPARTRHWWTFLCPAAFRSSRFHQGLYAADGREPRAFPVSASLSHFLALPGLQTLHKPATGNEANVAVEINTTSITALSVNPQRSRSISMRRFCQLCVQLEGAPRCQANDLSRPPPYLHCFPPGAQRAGDPCGFLVRDASRSLPEIGPAVFEFGRRLQVGGLSLGWITGPQAQLFFPATDQPNKIRWHATASPIMPELECFQGVTTLRPMCTAPVYQLRGCKAINPKGYQKS